MVITPGIEGLSCRIGCVAGGPGRTLPATVHNEVGEAGRGQKASPRGRPGPAITDEDSTIYREACVVIIGRSEGLRRAPRAV
jgi:hypothetical protein